MQLHLQRPVDDNPAPAPARSLGQRVRALRHARGLRRVDTARAADTTSTWLSRLERGHIPHPRPDVLARLARVLGVSPHTLLTGEPDPPRTAPTPPRADGRAADSTPVVVDLLTEAVHYGNFAAARPMLAPGFAVQGAVPGGRLDAGEIKSVIERLRSAFPDLRISIDDAMADGERVAFRWTLQGTRRDSISEVPTIEGLFQCRGSATLVMRNGILTEGTVALDDLNHRQFNQLGITAAGWSADGGKATALR